MEKNPTGGMPVIDREGIRVASILIVDDIDYVRKRISAVLVKQGYEVFVASNGNEAIEVVRNNIIDLLIIDIVMPEKNGMETLLEFREELSGIKKIIISGEMAKRTESFTSLAQFLGVGHVLYKPFRQQVLLDHVKSLLGERGQ
jgi:DNA-binding response OmpR family regulator